jgi:hypothetical protein
VRNGRDRRRPAQAGYTSNDVKVRRRKNSWLFPLHMACKASRGIHKLLFQDYHSSGTKTRSFAQISYLLLHRLCSCSCPLAGATFKMRSPAHASTSKLTRGLINAAIGSFLGAPRKRTTAHHSTPYAAFFAILVGEKKEFSDYRALAQLRSLHPFHLASMSSTQIPQ